MTRIAIRTLPYPLPDAEVEEALPQYLEAITLVASTAARFATNRAVLELMAATCALEIVTLQDTPGDQLEAAAEQAVSQWCEMLAPSVYSVTISEGELVLWEDI